MKVRGVFEEKSNWNILKLLKIKASEYGSKEFIRFDSGSSLSFKLLDELSDCLAYKLLDIGLKEDENVFCLLKNRSRISYISFCCNESRSYFCSHKYRITRTILRASIS